MAQDGRLEDAIDVWQSLAADSPAGSPRLGLLRLQIGRAAQEPGIEPPPIARPQEPGPEAPAEVPRRPAAGDIEAVQSMPPEERQAFIRTMGDHLPARLEPQPAPPARSPRPTPPS